MAQSLSKYDADLQSALDKRGTPPTPAPQTAPQDTSNVSTRKLREKIESRQINVDLTRQARLHDKALQLEDGQGEKLQVQSEGEQQLGVGGAIAQTAQNIQQNVNDKLTPAANKIGSLRTVGGLGLLFTILFVLLVAIVRVNSSGDTRLKQFWYMLNGRATLQGRQVPAAQTGAQGSSANFGTTTGTGTSGQSSANFGTGSGGPFVANPGFVMQSPYRNNGAF